ncbi:ABC transporter substrate-binding protein [Siminovitchia terrae]|uniref:ABC transporter substrate-binding protein n=1 Tax=Siminovitchia terrae TaxID=1914933 RepID=A0A429XC78_SIMTE|nr:biotin/lipoyl-binding protein [Siminovitchia terrae]RST61064.1 biotin/lipoyl-binding protein [Siminovitchia terrae]GIN90923.1 ABC transporter substrate-binding protein [Siminovitchia terrae]GIN97709.1 ABC transporter substrate-binding protein [Siminovitchia terrae]
MKKKAWIWAGSIVGVLVLALVVTLVIRAQAGKMAVADDEESLLVQKVSEQELSESILVTGKIVPEDEQKVYLDAEKGAVTEFKVKENQKVKAGDPLFVYDSSKLQSEYNKAVRERDLVQKRSQTEINQIAEMNKRIANAKNKPAPSGDGEDDEAASEDVNSLTSEKLEMETQHESTKSEIESAQEQINDLDTQIKEMTVTSKIDGIVVKVDRNAVSTEGGETNPAVHIISSQPFKVIGTMSEFDAVKIKEKQKVIIRPKVYKDKEWKGAIESVSQFPNEEGGDEEFSDGGGGGGVTMYPFKVAITDDTSKLRQGFHVSLEIKIDGDGKKMAIPHAAILEEEDSNTVFVLKDGKLEMREIETGTSNDEFIEVKNGLEKDELVVIAPNEGLHDGMEVTTFDEIE